MRYILNLVCGVPVSLGTAGIYLSARSCDNVYLTDGSSERVQYASLTRIPFNK